MIVHVIASPTGAIWSRLGPYDPDVHVAVQFAMWHAANVRARTPGELRAKLEKQWDIPPEARAAIGRTYIFDDHPLANGDLVHFHVPR